jgi:hypothetical protein
MALRETRLTIRSRFAAGVSISDQPSGSRSYIRERSGPQLLSTIGLRVSRLAQAGHPRLGFSVATGAYLRLPSKR